MKRKSFSPEFKREAVALLARGDRPAADLAREIGIPRNCFYKWREQLAAKGEAAFPGSGRKSEPDAELAELRREVAQLKEECDILKKAAAYFAKELK